jgi:choline kinase
MKQPGCAQLESPPPPEGPPPERLILLAAGAGRRLMPHTRERPKCLVQVGPTTIAERALTQLDTIGVREVCVVVGFAADRIRSALGTKYGGVRIRYVHNPDYASTHTGYSLELARDLLDRDVAILEADVLLRSDWLASLLTRRQSVWAGIRAAPAQGEGILLRGEPHQPLREARRFDALPAEEAGFHHKCGGLQVLRGEAPRDVARELRRAIDDDRRVMADLVIARVFDRAPILLAPLPTDCWAEVDDEKDLARARRLFAPPAATT